MRQDLEAYRYFFPAGWLLGIWGVILWALFPWNLVQYPGFSHPEIMTGGFFLCFVCGFLMTAAPKFTQSFGPTPLEHKIALGLLAALFVSLPLGKAYFLAVVIALFIFLMVYLVRRFRARKANPPDSFIFVGFGMFTGLFGAVLLWIAEISDVPTALRDVARLFFLQTYIMSLVLGVGSRLMPALLGRAPLPTEADLARPRRGFFFLAAIAFLISYVLEVFANALFAHVLRTLVIMVLAFTFWKLHLLPLRRAVHSYLLWISAWSVVVGEAAMIFFPDARVHILHLVLVSGLSLMTFMIASRVGLSHGKHNMMIEKNSKVLLISGILMALAGFTRLSAGFAPALYQSHLLYASITWTVALLIWGALMLPKFIRVHQ